MQLVYLGVAHMLCHQNVDSLLFFPNGLSPMKVRLLAQRFVLFLEQGLISRSGSLLKWFCVWPNQMLVEIEFNLLCIFLKMAIYCPQGSGTLGQQYTLLYSALHCFTLLYSA